MRTALTILNDIRVASPCHADWNEMLGDDHSRFCGKCEKHVYNLSSMTSQEAVDLVREKEGNLCVRFYRRHDGTMLTADCPVGIHHRIRRRRRLSSALAGVTSLLFVGGCARDEGTPDNRPFIDKLIGVFQKPEPTVGRMMMGMPMPPIQGEICPAEVQPPPEGN